MEITTESVESIRSRARTKLPDFLLAEYNHMVDSFLRNEESGEKRATFFVTLVGAAGGILGFVFGERSSIVSGKWIPVTAAAVAAVLLCLGLLTVRRLVTRNIESDKYKFALRALRRLFLTQVEAASLPNAFFQPYQSAEDRPRGVFGIGKGGWLETVAFVNALLMGAVGLLVSWRVGWQCQIVIVLAGGVTMWIGQLSYAHRVIASSQTKLKDAEADCLKERTPPLSEDRLKP
jgi:hypothetical protein